MRAPRIQPQGRLNTPGWQSIIVVGLTTIVEESVNMKTPAARGTDTRFPESQAPSQIAEWWQEVAASIRAERIPRALRFLRWIAAVSPEDAGARLWLLHLSRDQGVGEKPRPSQTTRARTGMQASARTGLKIGAAIVLSVIGMALLPFLQLPYGSAEWRDQDTITGDSQTATPTATPGLAPSQSIPCAELPEPGAPLAAVVGEQGIGLETFERELDQYLTELEESGVDFHEPGTLATMPEYRRHVLDTLVRDVLIQQAAVSAGIFVAEEQIDTYLESEVGPPEAQAELKQELEAKGQTWEEFRQEACQKLLRQSVLAQVTSDVAETMEMVWARQIVVETQQDAQNALTRLAAGEDFSELAQELSVDDATREEGGDLGWFPRQSGLVPPEVEEAAFLGSPGLVQGPIPVGDQFYLVQTIDVQSDRPVDAAMSALLRESDLEAWLAEEVAEADVSILVDLYALPGGAVTPEVVPETGAGLFMPGWLFLTGAGLALVGAGSALHIYSRMAA